MQISPITNAATLPVRTLPYLPWQIADRAFVIAEIGINHNGDLDITKKLIDAAHAAGCDAVKFQKRTIDLVYTAEVLAQPRESPWGTTQRAQKEGLEFNEAAYDEIDRYCRDLGIDWFASAWDVPSQHFLAKYKLKYNKIASAMITHRGVVEAVARERKPLASQWYELALGAAALAGAAAAILALHVIHASGGFYMPAPAAQFVQSGHALARNLGVTAQGLLLLGGADFLGLHPAAATGFIVLHVVGVLLAAWATCLAAVRFLRDRDLVAQLLVAGIAINLAVYVLSTKANTVTQTREIAAVLPFSAALAGRLLGGRLLDGRLLAGLRPTATLVPLLLVLAGYLAGLGYELSQPPVPAQNQQLTSWLAARHLHTGLSSYWESNVVTLTSGDQVQIRTVSVSGGRLTASHLESRAQWYDPRLATANFVVLFPGVPGYGGFTNERAVLATFGRPARSYRVGSYTVLIWHRNLLSELR